MSDRNKKPRKPFHEQVAENLIQQLETGTAPWLKPWSTASGAGELGFAPVNPVNGTRYRGVNFLNLLSQGYTDPRWMTYKQAQAAGYQVRKGETSTPVQYWKFRDQVPVLDDNGDHKRRDDGKKIYQTVELERPRVFYASVFNASQIDGIPPLEPTRIYKAVTNLADQIEQAADLVPAGTAVSLTEGANQLRSLLDTATAEDPVLRSQGLANNALGALREVASQEATAKAADIESLIAEVNELTWARDDRAEAILRESGAQIRHQTGNRAFYSSVSDQITLPDREQFAAADAYYATALHELGHWTGHPSRLDRDLSHPFGSEGYAREELRAEISSLMVGSELGLGHDPEQHAAYVGSWIKALKEDPLEIVRASSDAEKIYNMVLGFELQQEKRQEQAIANKDARDVAEYQQQQQQPVVQRPEQEVQKEAAKDGHRIKVERDYAPEPDYPGAPVPVAWRHAACTIFDAHMEKSGGVPGYDKTQYLFHNIKSSRERIQNLYWDGRVPTAAEKAEEKTLREGIEEAEAWLLENVYLNRQIKEEVYPTVRDFTMVAEDSHDDFMAEMEGPAHSLMNELNKQEADAIRSSGSAFNRYRAGKNGAEIGPGILDAMSSEILDESMDYYLGVRLPHDWNGDVRIVEPGADNGEYHVYAGKEDGLSGPGGDAFAFVAAAPTAEEANRVAERLLLVEAMAADNFEERALLALDIKEQRLRRDPRSTDEEIEAAKETRKAMEARVLSNKGQEGQYQDHPVSSEIIRFGRDRVMEQDKAERIYINVPFREKEQAKELGAKWDGGARRSWYIPAGVESEPFEKWLNQAQTAPDPEAREYLAVPYHDRKSAKAAGALWDGEAKAWYIGPGADTAALSKWAADKNPAQDPAMSPQEEFADKLRELGCIVDGRHPIMDGQAHRIKTQGDKSGEKAGFYKAYLDGRPAGYIKNNRTGQEERWAAKGYSLSPEERANLEAVAAQKQRERAAEREAQYQRAAERVRQQCETAVPVIQPTPYLASKGVLPSAGLLSDEKGTTFIPAHDSDGTVWTMQYIRPDGVKRFAKEAKKEGCFHALGGIDKLADQPIIAISEGYATAATVKEALGLTASVAAFDSGNLEPVAVALRSRYPDKPILITGDDDHHLPLQGDPNSGRIGAEKAAAAAKAEAVFPVFGAEERAAQGKGLTDFNDLAQKGLGGKSAVSRQLKSAVERARQKAVESPELQQERSTGRRQGFSR